MYSKFVVNIPFLYIYIYIYKEFIYHAKQSTTTIHIKE